MCIELLFAEDEFHYRFYMYFQLTGITQNSLSIKKLIGKSHERRPIFRIA